jgi:hypothetical protein
VLIAACLWGYGAALLLVSLAGSDSPRHYMIVIAPVMALWAAMAVLYGDRSPRRRTARAILVAVCVCQAAISAGLLFYLHQNGGAHGGDFGATWAAQQPGYVAPR